MIGTQPWRLVRVIIRNIFDVRSNTEESLSQANSGWTQEASRDKAEIPEPRGLGFQKVYGIFTVIILLIPQY